MTTNSPQQFLLRGVIIYKKTGGLNNHGAFWLAIGAQGFANGCIAKG